VHRTSSGSESGQHGRSSGEEYAPTDLEYFHKIPRKYRWSSGQEWNTRDKMAEDWRRNEIAKTRIYYDILIILWDIAP